MTAPIKPPWHPPKVTVVETVGPLRCCKLYTLYDGRKVVVPGMWTMTEALNVEAWVRAIAEIIRPLRQYDFFTSELMDHANRVEGPLRSLIGDRDNRELGMVLHEIMGKDVDGCTIEQRYVERKRARWLVVFSKN